jgi:hypothetical protein
MTTLLSKVPSLVLLSSVASLPDRISSASQRQLAAGSRDPSAEVWIGTADRILRRITVSLDMPVSGHAGEVGPGLTAVALTLQYSDLNRPQTITAPAKLQPYSALQAKLLGFAQGPLLARPTKVPRTRRAPSPPPDLTLSPYAQCVSNAAGNASKRQACASLSNGTSTHTTRTSTTHN